MKIENENEKFEELMAKPCYYALEWVAVEYVEYYVRLERLHSHKMAYISVSLGLEGFTKSQRDLEGSSALRRRINSRHCRAW